MENKLAIIGHGRPETSKPFTVEPLKWIMNNPKWFTAERDGFTLQVHLSGLVPTWYLFKDGIEVDSCFNYTPTKCELSARVQAEEAYIDYLNKKES